MITFGLTGGIACGKSAVTKTFRKNNIPIVDADVVAREVVIPGSIGNDKIMSRFGFPYFNQDGTLDRAKLAGLVFANHLAMTELNRIMKPLIESESDRQIAALHNEGNSIVGYDAALIIEQGNADKYRPLIVVSCPPVMQIERLMRRNDLTEAQAMSRINAQMSVEEKVKLADYVVDTSGSIENSINATLLIIELLKNRLTINS